MSRTDGTPPRHPRTSPQLPSSRPPHSVKRRTLLTTAWAAPVATVATAAPAFAASPSICPELQLERGAWMELAFAGVTWDGRWQTGTSAATLRLSVGKVLDNAWGALAFMSDQNDVWVTARTYLYILTWEIDMSFTSTPANWATSKTQSGNLYTYSMEYTGPPITKEASVPLDVEPDGLSPLVFIPPTEFGIAINQNQFADGETVSDGRRGYDYDTFFRVEYDVDVPGVRCDLPDQVYTRARSLDIWPD